MTDKQIIINGVDVSECIYYQYNMCTATKDNYGDCSFYCKDYDMNDCYYKQLQREKQSSQEARDTAIKEFNREEELKTLLKRKEQKLERITNMLFTGQCSNCEGYSPNCSNKELCNFKHNIKNIIDEVENEN